MKVVECERLCLPADHPAFADHFPDEPIAPGALLLSLAIAELIRHGLPAPKSISWAKFQQPGRPGQALFLNGREIENSGEIAVAISNVDNDVILSFRYCG